jgi:hypothetical protein
MKQHKSLSLILKTNKASIIPDDARDAVRKKFHLPEAQPVSDLIQSEDFQTLKQEYLEEAENSTLTDIDFSAFINSPPLFDLRNAWIDYVDQRERLKDTKYRKGIIDMAITFSVKDAEFPALRVPMDVPEDQRAGHLLDWQKRCLALMLRSVYEYPTSQIASTTSEFSRDFSGQFRKKDRMQEYDKFKAFLAEESEKHWAMQHCFDRLNLSAYPFSAPPQITALGDITKAMYDPSLNPNEKNLGYADKKFLNFVRAVGIYRRVWPEASKKFIQGSFVRGMTAIIASFDQNILNGTDDWIVEILEEAKDPKYNLHTDGDGNPIGLVEPNHWTAKKNWQGNRFHQNAIVSFAEAWNTIRKPPKLNKRIPALDDNPIKGLRGDAKMLQMQVV